MVFLKYFFEKVDFEKNQQMTNSMQSYPVGKEIQKADLITSTNFKICLLFHDRVVQIVATAYAFENIQPYIYISTASL